MSNKEAALEATGRSTVAYIQCMEITLDNDNKHQDSKNYLPKNGNKVATGTALQEQLLFLIKFSRNGIQMLACVAT